ncbi:MAG: acyl-CoA-binding protein [Deltaproteobacteria bacterium]|nr:acyl-CoA-binding protein [Deltaproteobacteria bacterium]
METNLTEQFAAAQARVKTLRQTPSSDVLLKLYALYKQASVGDATGKRPGMLDIKGRAKYDAWKAQQGLGQDDAMQRYIALVDQLLADDK